MPDNRSNPDEPLYQRIVSAGGKVRYVPVCGSRRIWDVMHPGHYLLTVGPNGKFMRHLVHPRYAETEAALVEVREAMLAAFTKANASRPTQRLLTERERRAVQAYREVMGEEVTLIFDGISPADFIEAGLEVLRQRLEDMRKEWE